MLYKNQFHPSVNLEEISSYEDEFLLNAFMQSFLLIQMMSVAL